MPDEREVLRYELDISDAEAKSAKLLQLLEEIKAKKAGGQDVSELEAQFHKEADGLSRVAQKQKEAGVSTEDLTRQKERLANVVGLLGGQFGGVLGQLGGVVELLAQGGKAAIGFGAATEAVTAGVLIYQRLRDAIKEAVEEQQRLNEAVHEGQQAKQEADGQVAEALAGAGALTGENVRAATSMYDQLRKTYGVKDARLAGLAAIAGVSPEEAAALGAMQRPEGGPTFGSAEQMQRALAQARKEGTYGEFVSQAGVWATTGGFGVVAEAMVPGARGGAQRRPIDVAYEALRGQVPEGMSREEWGRKVGDIRDAERKMAPLREELAGLGGREGPQSFGVRAVLKKLEPLEEAVRGYGWVATYVAQLAEVQAHGPFGAATPPEGSGPGSAAAAQTVININEVINAGHVQMGPDRRNNRHMVRLGLSKQDHRRPP